METWVSGCMETWVHGDLGEWVHGDLGECELYTRQWYIAGISRLHAYVEGTGCVRDWLCACR